MRCGFILKLLFILLTVRLSWAQDVDRSLLVGLDLSKNLPTIPKGKQYEYFFQRGILIELPVYFPIQVNGLYVKVTPGYASVAANPIYNNLDYHNEGILLKAGVEYFPNRYFSFGGGANAAVYEEYGQYHLPGPFYGDLHEPFPKRRLVGFGLESHYAVWIPIAERFFISPEARFIIHSISMKGSPDSYYIPGMGATDRDLPITGGVSVRISYAFPLPQ